MLSNLRNRGIKYHVRFQHDGEILYPRYQPLISYTKNFSDPWICSRSPTFQSPFPFYPNLRHLTPLAYKLWWIRENESCVKSVPTEPAFTSVTSASLCTWGVQGLRSPNFFLGMEADRNVKVVGGDVAVL